MMRAQGGSTWGYFPPTVLLAFDFSAISSTVSVYAT